MRSSIHIARLLRLAIGICHNPWTFRILALVMPMAAGCESLDTYSPAPCGPGAATEQNLQPWLASATSDSRTGHLQLVNVASPLGSYYTWSLAPADPSAAVEVDVRPCAAEARCLAGHTVTVSGKLIYRGQWHLPLLVAEQIIPSGPDTNVVFNRAAEFVGEADPATDQVDVPTTFHAEQAVAAAD